MINLTLINSTKRQLVGRIKISKSPILRGIAKLNGSDSNMY